MPTCVRQLRARQSQGDGFRRQACAAICDRSAAFDGFLGPVPIPGQPFEFGSEFGPFEGSYAVAVDDFPNLNNLIIG